MIKTEHDLHVGLIGAVAGFLVAKLLLDVPPPIVLLPPPTGGGGGGCGCGDKSTSRRFAFPDTVPGPGLPSPAPANVGNPATMGRLGLTRGGRF